VEVHRVCCLAGVLCWEYQTAGGFSLDAKGFFIETVFMAPE
jgi:hypothetical protein